MQAIDHVIHLTPENRSFHYVLGFLEDHRNHFNYDLQGNRIVCSPVTPMTGGDSIVHDIAETLFSIQGVNSEPMTGFIAANHQGVYNTDAYEPAVYPADPEQLMGYVKEGSMPVLHTLAKNFCVCNRWFSSSPTETFPNRSYMIAATSQGHDNNLPKKIWELLYTVPTIFDRLTEAKLSWKIYYPDYLDLIVNLDVDAFPKLANIVNLNTLLDDLQSNGLPEYSYVELDTEDDSIQELVPYISSVEAYIGQVYNALRASKYWDKTLVIIAFDEHGGFYDPIIPPPCQPPDYVDVVYHSSIKPSVPSTFKFDQLGVRVPAILISPWLNHGIDSTIYDHTSVLAFLEHRFNLRPLTLRDAQANYQFKFRTTLRPDSETPTELVIPPSPNIDTSAEPPALTTKILIDFTKLLIKIRQFFKCS